jgi:predicted MFS family arabinose efflux permease
MDRRAFVGLMAIETTLAFGNTFAASFNIIYLLKVLEMPLWSAPIYLLMGFGISTVVSLWMSWKPHLDPRNAMIVGLAFLSIEYTLFLFLEDGWLLVMIVGVAFGLFYPLFWTPFNILMARMTDKADRGFTYGAFFLVWPAVAFVAPLLGGLVIGFVSYDVLYVLGLAMIVTTALLVVAYRNYIPKDQVMKITLKEIGTRNAISALGEGGFEGIFWIDYVLVAYYFSQDEVSLGTLFSLFGLSAGIMGIIFGKISDKIQNRALFLRASVVASIPCIVLIYLVSTIEGYAVAMGLLEFASFMFPVFLFAILTDRLEDAKNDSVLTREYILDIGRTISIAIMVVLLYLDVTPQACFLIAVPFLVMGLAAHERKKGPVKTLPTAGHADQMH